MTRRSHRYALLASVAVLGSALAFAPALSDSTPSPSPPMGGGGGGGGVSMGGGGGEAAPAPRRARKAKSKGTKKSTTKKKRTEQQFYDGYKVAYDLLQAKKFEEAIAAFRALNQDNHADVATSIGFASRQLGRYDDAKYWYEKALASDSTNVRTWQYYGMWHVEQGNVLKAQDYLANIRKLCGNSECKEYASLKGAIEGTVVY